MDNANQPAFDLQNIAQKIHEIRGHKVMLDFDLAAFYEVKTKALKQAVRRNTERFPPDFMFELTASEFESLRSQIVTSNRGGLRYLPFAFTEQGVAMLSAILHSPKAIDVSVALMRAFVALRRYALTYNELSAKIHALEAKFDKNFADINEVLTFLADENQTRSEEIAALQTTHQTAPEWENRPRIGFKK